jgi:hypothetical protein
MHESQTAIAEALAPTFRRLGWTKKALTWRKVEPDTVLVFHVEKNRWGANRYSLHCGVYIRALGPELTPLFHRCPVQATVDRIAPDRGHVELITDFEDPRTSPSERMAAIVDVVEACAIPWLQQHSTIRGLKMLVAQDYDRLLPRVPVWRAVYDYLRSVNEEGLAGS